MAELNNLSGSPTLFRALVEQKAGSQGEPAMVSRRDKWRALYDRVEAAVRRPSLAFLGRFSPVPAR